MHPTKHIISYLDLTDQTNFLIEETIVFALSIAPESDEMAQSLLKAAANYFQLWCHLAMGRGVRREQADFAKMEKMINEAFSKLSCEDVVGVY